MSPQYMRPTGVPVTVGWSGSAADVADAGGVNDATYIESPLSPTSASYWDCALSAGTDPNTDDGLVLRFRQALNTVGGDAKAVTVRIYRASDHATVYQSPAVPVGYPSGDAPPMTLTAAQAALIASYASGALRVRITATGAAKQVLTSTDLAYIGGFRLPGFRSPVRCLTGRTVAGQTHLFCTLPYDYGADVLEVAVPAIVTPPQNGVQAAVLQRYAASSFYYANGVNQWWYGDNQGHGVPMTGYWPKALYWDASDERLYWSYGTNSTDDYSTLTTYTNEPWFNSFGASTINISTGASGAIGSWGTSARRVKARNSGMLGIPDWFAAAYLGGRRLGLGFGGIRSIVTVGDCSVAPTLVAIDTPSAATNRAALDGTTMLYYPWIATAYQPDLTHPKRPHRDVGYLDNFGTPAEQWNPVNGVGFWDWRQRFFGAMVWVDTPTKTGLLLNINQGTGRGWYENSDLRSVGGADVGYIWSPYDLIPVIQGTAETWWPQPTEFWRWTGGYTGRYSDATAAETGSWLAHSYDYGASVWFDPVQSRVYVSRYEPTLENNVVSVYEVT